MKTQVLAPWLIAAFTMTWPVFAHQAVDVANPPGHEKMPKWEIETDTVDIDGDPGPITSDARKNWKVACDKWRVEFREDNKENKIISISCGTPTCSGDVGNKTCTSKGTYKMKVREESD